MATRLALGIDAGGTSSRALLIDQTGARIGTGSAGPANPVGGDRQTALANMTLAARRALDGVRARAVTAVCVGAAGVLSVNDEVRSLAAELRDRFGVDCEVELVSDAVIAFAAGSDSPDGTVVVSGTGAVAFGVRGHREPARRADGYGWLLGDAGSGFWVGREAVAATLRHLDGNGPGGRLVESIIAAADPAERRSGSLIADCMAEPPVRLARFASVVCEAADSGDEVAVSIVRRASAQLVETVAAVAEPGLPIVMAGSLLTRPTPMARLLERLLASRWPDAPISRAAAPVEGAAWLAAHDFEPDRAGRRRLHRELVGR